MYLHILILDERKQQYSEYRRAIPPYVVNI